MLNYQSFSGLFVDRCRVHRMFGSTHFAESCIMIFIAAQVLEYTL